MMARHKMVAIVLISLLLLVQVLGGCKSESEPPETSDTSSNITEVVLTPETTVIEKPTDSWYQGIADAVKDLQPGRVPDYLTEESANKTGEEFDINKTFSVLPNLSMKPGYILDYVYLYDGMGGRPIIYVRMENQEPYRNYEEYSKDAQENQELENTYDFVSRLIYGQGGMFENKIVIDGTEKGFFEYIVLQVLGGQFYLWWHANYDDTMIICDPNEIDNIVQEMENWISGELPPDIVEKARGLDYRPVIEFKEDTVDVSITIFTKWGGFKRLTFTINREYPHTIIDVQSEVIIEYDCGVAF
jgi:hypothetical protein